MYAESIPAGQLISAPKGWLRHVGLSLGNGLAFHNNPTNGEHISSLAHFSKGKPIRVDGPVAHHEFRDAMANIAALLSDPKGYHLTENNCEQSLNRVLGKPAISPQLRFWAFAALFTAGCAYLATRK